MFVETQGRSIAKTMVWRVIATVITGSVIYAFTGELLESSKITLAAAALSMLAYYIFERTWNKVGWGKIDEE